MNKKLTLVLALAVLSPMALRAGLAGLAGKLKKTLEEVKEGKQADLAKIMKSAQEITKDVAALAAKAKVYPDDTKVSFEVKNKSVGRIGVTIDDSYGQRYSQEGVSIFQAKPDKTLSLEPPITAGFVITVTTKDRSFKYKTPAGKTAYLTWDGTTLRPQTGPAGGALNKTDTGLSLGKNVTPRDVVEMEFEEVTPSPELTAAIEKTKLPPPMPAQEPTQVAPELQERVKKAPLPPPMPGAVPAAA